MKLTRVEGHCGTQLAVFTSRRSAQRAQPAILFIHGFCQSSQAWTRQFESPDLADFHLTAYDLRGHGASDKPESASDYDDSRIWANDLKGVIDGIGLARPVLVAWSYGARVVLDYLAHYGSSHIAGINFVGSALRLPNFPAPRPNLSFDLAADDPDCRVAATAAFLRSCFHCAPSDAEFAKALAYNMMVPAAARRFILRRAPVGEDSIKLIDVPALISHGEADALMPPDAPRRASAHLRHARFSLYAGVGHAVMIEASGRFNAELAAFAKTSTRSPSAHAKETVHT